MRWSKIVKKILFSSLLISLCGSRLMVQGEQNILNETIQSFEYPLTPDDSGWSKLTSEQKYEACRISQSILNNMSNEELIQAVLDFPFLYDVFLYSSLEEGVQAIEKVCDAYVELLNRDGGKNSIVNVLSQRSRGVSEGMDISEKVRNDALSVLIAYQDDFEITSTDVEIIDAVSELINYEYIESNSLNTTTSKAYTPKGNWVGDVATYCEHNADWHEEEAQQTAQNHSVTYVSTGSCHYNCHSYAWHSQSQNNSLWIPNPSLYMTDGSYVQLVNPVSDGRIFYGTNTLPSHSGIIITMIDGSIMVVSKWGSSGVFIHSIYNVPKNYDTNNISYWRLA